MLLNNVIDTLLNIFVFAFIGFLIWLYFKKESIGGAAQNQESEKDSQALD